MQARAGEVPLGVLHPQLHAEVGLPPTTDGGNPGGPRGRWCLRADRTFNLTGPVEMSRKKMYLSDIQAKTVGM